MRKLGEHYSRGIRPQWTSAPDKSCVGFDVEKMLRQPETVIIKLLAPLVPGVAPMFRIYVDWAEKALFPERPIGYHGPHDPPHA
jgi:hypothetical protein